ncbi:MAG: AAA family ATPase [Luteolibacter sp.]
MISEIQIENFKSIAKLSLKPGSVTVLIGENGSGKSNILEAIGFAAAASADKLDDEFLFNRGIRVTDREWMTAGFHEVAASPEQRQAKPILIRIDGGNEGDSLALGITRQNGNGSERWLTQHLVKPAEMDEILRDPDFLETVKQSELFKLLAEGNEDASVRFLAQVRAAETKRKQAAHWAFRDFMIYAPENSAMRRFEEEGAIKPLGNKGEGLLKLLQTTSEKENGRFTNELKSHLNLLGWFADLRFPSDADEIKGRLLIQDRWLPADGKLFDQRSANEGFLYLLFYFTLFLSKATPQFFAIDNIDTSLNPKLCAELMRQLAVLAEKTGKQVICTTHNPAILDGLNLHDDKQRLYVVRRNNEGHTIVNRVKAPRPRPDGPPVKLSTAFMSGLLGGLPDHF